MQSLSLNVIALDSPSFFLGWFEMMTCTRLRWGRWRKHCEVELGYYWPSADSSETGVCFPTWLMMNKWKHEKQNHGSRWTATGGPGNKIHPWSEMSEQVQRPIPGTMPLASMCCWVGNPRQPDFPQGEDTKEQIHRLAYSLPPLGARKILQMRT